MFPYIVSGLQLKVDGHTGVVSMNWRDPDKGVYNLDLLLYTESSVNTPLLSHKFNESSYGPSIIHKLCTLTKNNDNNFL